MLSQRQLYKHLTFPVWIVIGIPVEEDQEELFAYNKERRQSVRVPNMRAGKEFCEQKNREERQRVWTKIRKGGRG